MQNRLTSLQPFNTDIAALLLRLIFGGLFIYHGYTKLIAFDQILPMFQDFLGIGAKLSFILLLCAELGCGILVTIGFLTRITVIPVFFAMNIAFFMAHAQDTFVVKEQSFTFLLVALVVFVLGSGKYSVDKLLFKK
ncbi:MAG TPA: DoxX family protein [Sphingobacteriaceae bacterium]|nr:DoxX family protein [Sphingobacteriaceae bacterium]